jgi:hypothetical protein
VGGIREGEAEIPGFFIKREGTSMDGLESNGELAPAHITHHRRD